MWSDASLDEIVIPSDAADGDSQVIVGGTSAIADALSMPASVTWLGGKFDGQQSGQELALGIQPSGYGDATFYLISRCPQSGNTSPVTHLMISKSDNDTYVLLGDISFTTLVEIGSIGTIRAKAPRVELGNNANADVLARGVSLPRGVHSYGERTASVSGLTSTTEVITTTSVDYRPNRVYAATLIAGVNSTVVAGQTFTPRWVDVRLRRAGGGAQVAEFFRFPTVTSGDVYAAQGTRLFKTGASAPTGVSLAVTVAPSASASATAGMFANANDPSTLIIRDIGSTDEYAGIDMPTLT